MKLFLDSQLKEEITDKIIDLGIVKLGDSQEYTLWVLNDSEFLVRNIEFRLNTNEVKIKQSPNRLIAGEKEALILKWTPAITVEKNFKPKIEIFYEELRPWG